MTDSEKKIEEKSSKESSETSAPDERAARNWSTILQGIAKFAPVAVLALALPITLFVMNQRIDVRQRAAENPTPVVRPYKVKLFYFYAAGTERPNDEKVKIIKKAMSDVQKWYYDKLGVGKTFFVDPEVTIVQGDNTADYYKTANSTDTWHNIENEIKSKFGNVCGSQTIRVIFVTRPLDTFSGGPSCGWWNNGQMNASTPGQNPNSGTAIMNDDIVDVDLLAKTRANAQYPSGYCIPHNPAQALIPLGQHWCNHNVSMGGITHEFGHALSLGHPSRVTFGSNTPIYDDVCVTSAQQFPECARSAMNSYGTWPNNELLDQVNNPAFAPDKTTLKSSPWFWYSFTTEIPTITQAPSASPTPIPTTPSTVIPSKSIPVFVTPTLAPVSCIVTLQKISGYTACSNDTYSSIIYVCSDEFKAQLNGSCKQLSSWTTDATTACKSRSTCAVIPR